MPLGASGVHAYSTHHPHTRPDAHTLRVPSMRTEDRRLRREIEIREEVLQEAAEKIAHLRVRSDAITKKNQEVAEAEKRQLAAKDREKADYIARLRRQTSQNWASRQARYVPRRGSWGSKVQEETPRPLLTRLFALRAAGAGGLPCRHLPRGASPAQ